MERPISIQKKRAEAFANGLRGRSKKFEKGWNNGNLMKILYMGKTG